MLLLKASLTMQLRVQPPRGEQSWTQAWGAIPQAVGYVELWLSQVQLPQWDPGFPFQACPR